MARYSRVAGLIILMISLTGIFLPAIPSMADSVYDASVIYTLPWGGYEGNEIGGLSTGWNDPPNGPEYFENEPPEPWAISNEGELIIVDNWRINKYDSSGNFVASFNYRQNGMQRPSSIARSDSG